MKKKLPKFKTDKQIKEFMKQDLTDYINAENLIPVTFEFEKKDRKLVFKVDKKLKPLIEVIGQKFKEILGFDIEIEERKEDKVRPDGVGRGSKNCRAA